MFVHHLLFATAIAAAPAPRRPLIRHRGGLGDRDARIELWTDNGNDPYRAGERARVFLRGAEDAYVLVLRVDTDGRIRVLFPREPWMDNYVRGGREYEIDQARDSAGFAVEDAPGIGYLFGVSSPDPFQLEPIVRGDHWDYSGVDDGRIHGDPYVALTALARRLLPDGDDDWDYDIAPYYVQDHYDYPRFLCYDCHASARAGGWDPYAATCPRFRVEARDDPTYYPYRYYQGRNVVFTRPLRPAPRFVFRERQSGADDRFVTVTRGRPREDSGRARAGVPPRGVEPRRPARPAPRPAVKAPPPRETPPKGKPELRRRKP